MRIAAKHLSKLKQFEGLFNLAREWKPGETAKELAIQLTYDLLPVVETRFNCDNCGKFVDVFSYVEPQLYYECQCGNKEMMRND